MRPRSVIAASLPALLAIGCASTPPVASDAGPARPDARRGDDHLAMFPAGRTATLWVNGLACPF